MSDDQLDDEFKNRVKQVFDNYEDDTGADGWMLLREKFPQKRSDHIEAWLWRYAGVAALALAVLSVGLWFNSQYAKQSKLAAKNSGYKNTIAVKTAAAKNKTHVTGPGPNFAYQTPVNPVNNHNTVNNVHKSLKTASPALAVIKPLHKSSYTANNMPSYPVVGRSNDAVTANKPAINNAAAINSNSNGITAPNKPVISNMPNYKADNNTKGIIASAKPAAKANQFLITDSAKNNKVAAVPASGVKTPDAIIKKQPDKKSIQSLFDNDKYSSTQNAANIKVKDRKVIFGVYAATYVNYSKGSNNQFNAGAGISSDIRLTKNLSIATGLAIAKNSFNYNSLTPNSPVLLSDALSHNAQPAMFALSQVSPTSKNLNANLVGLDVPVDLKYMFNPQKSSAYIAAGLSSGAFINETYNYSYSYNVDNSPSNPQSQDGTTRKAFDNFYIAKMLNVSFGVGYPLGKGNQLIIEPFLKYPLTGLGDQHILFGSGGVNLKLNFDPPKSKR